jgi:parvulin-like peptidyl-prolyl isomerase
MRFPISVVFAFLAALPLAATDVTVVDEIVAKVNGEIITRSELARTLKQAELELQQRGVRGAALEQALKERRVDVLRDRIDQILLVGRAKDLNVNVDTELSKYLAEIQLQNKIADPDKFQAWIREQSGMSFEDFKAEVKNNMLTQRVIRQEVGEKLRIPKAEVQKYYEANKSKFIREERVFLREILVSTEGKDAAGVAAAERKAKDLVARARKGERFHELARDNSDAASSAQGGDIGGFKKGELDPVIEQMIWDQPKNYVTDPIRRPNGFLILKKEEHQKAGQATLEEAEPEIMDILSRPLFQPKIREYLTQLRMSAFLEIKDGFIDSGAAPGKDTRWSDPAQLKPETVSKVDVLAQTRRKRLLWLVPVPGTKQKPKGVQTVEATAKQK